MPAGSVPKKVEDLVKEVKKDNPDYSEEKVWATSWAIYCRYVNNTDKSCKRGPEDYLKGRGKKGATFTDLHGYTWGPKAGLEGPFLYKTKVVLYWDPQARAYYDPTRDLEIDSREFRQLTGERPKTQPKARMSSATRQQIVNRVAARALQAATMNPRSEIVTNIIVV